MVNPFAILGTFFRVYRLPLTFSIHSIGGAVVVILIRPLNTEIPPDTIEFALSGLVFGEILLPLTMGWLAAGIILRDPLKEVIIASPYSQTRLALKRLFTQLLSALLVWLIFLLVIWQQATSIQMNMLKLGLGILPVMLLFGAVCLWSGLRLGSWTSGGICVTILWGSGFVFRQVWLDILTPIYPFLTYFAAEHTEHPIWWTNRLMLCVVSVILILDVCRLLGNEEMFLTSGREDV